MRLTIKELRKKRPDNEFLKIPIHLLQSKSYKNIGAIEVFTYAFMADLADVKTKDKFIFKKAKDKFVKHWLNITDYTYKKTISNLIQNQIITDNDDEFIVKNIYLPVQNVKEEDLYYG